MLYEATNTPAMARTSNLNEELGQVLQALNFRHKQKRLMKMKNETNIWI